MITKTHLKGDAASAAIYSPCAQFRYELTRVWQPLGAKVLFIMLNPSTATEVQNDPTVERCERRARVLGFGGFRVVNIFAFRATDPKLMRAQRDPVGPGNDAAIANGVGWSDQIICGGQVEAQLRQFDQPLFHLGLTKDRQPKHPLYIGYAVQPTVWA
jgi:hypothetical protein